jgi:hypothetical protein
MHYSRQVIRNSTCNPVCYGQAPKPATKQEPQTAPKRQPVLCVPTAKLLATLYRSILCAMSVYLYQKKTPAQNQTPSMCPILMCIRPSISVQCKLSEASVESPPKVDSSPALHQHSPANSPSWQRPQHLRHLHHNPSHRPFRNNHIHNNGSPKSVHLPQPLFPKSPPPQSQQLFFVP